MHVAYLALNDLAHLHTDTVKNLAKNVVYAKKVVLLEGEANLFHAVF